MIRAEIEHDPKPAASAVAGSRQLHPSIEGTPESLAEVIAADPTHWLGCDAEIRNTSVLVKLLDTDDQLSLQVHPSDDYPGLSATESGKPEAWHVVEADAGAGILIGLQEHVAEGPKAEGGIRFAPLSIARLAGTGVIALPPSDVCRALTVVAGSMTVDGETARAGWSRSRRRKAERPPRQRITAVP